MAKTNKGGFMLPNDRVRFLSDQYKDTVLVAQAGDTGVVTKLSPDLKHVTVTLDKGGTVQARHKVMVKI